MARVLTEEQKARKSERNRAWRKANPERAREQPRAWKKANPEKVRERDRAWKKANHEKVRESDRAWKKANPEKTREHTRAWRKANPGAVSLSGIKNRSRSAGTLCTLQEDSRVFTSLCCEKTGLGWEKTTSARGPWQRSIDQINPGEGYTEENTQAVCLIYNIAKNVWTHEDVVKFARALVAKEDEWLEISPAR